MKELLKDYILCLLKKSSPEETSENKVIHVIEKTGNENLKLIIKSFFDANTKRGEDDDVTNIYITIGFGSKVQDENFNFNNCILENCSCTNEECLSTFLSYFNIYIEVKNSSIYIYGKYTKNSRNMSQTPMQIKGHLKYERSVSDFKKYFNDHFNASDSKFSSSGREDADVTCNNRPFLLQIVEPKRNLRNYNIKFEIYEDLELIDLTVVKKEIKSLIHDAEIKGWKKYTAKVFSLSEIKEIDLNAKFCLKQKTPIRVLHRRSNIIRTRNVEILEFKRLNKNIAEITILADAGTYIKEFINGDFGRTIPSLTSLNQSFCDCVELSVISVQEKEINKSFIISGINKI